MEQWLFLNSNISIVDSLFQCLMHGKIKKDFFSMSGAIIVVIKLPLGTKDIVYRFKLSYPGYGL